MMGFLLATRTLSFVFSGEKTPFLLWLVPFRTHPQIGWARLGLEAGDPTSQCPSRASRPPHGLREEQILGRSEVCLDGPCAALGKRGCHSKFPRLRGSPDV